MKSNNNKIRWVDLIKLFLIFTNKEELQSTNLKELVLGSSYIGRRWC